MRLTKDNFGETLTYKPDPKDKRDYRFNTHMATSEFKTTVAKLPNTVDHSFSMSSVKNQGNLGSCVGFAVTTMKEWQETREHLYEVSMGKKDHRSGKEYNLSESWVYWNAKKIDPWQGEEGTSIRFAMKVLHKLGVPCESAWPYKDVNYGEPESWATLIARW